MKAYTVHVPPGGDRDAAALGERLAFVKDGFSWPALFFPLIWLVWHRLWRALALWLTVAAAIAVAGSEYAAAGDPLAAVALVFALWFAVQANDFRRNALDRRGWEIGGVAMGRNLAEAERDFLLRWIGGPRPSAPRAPRPGAVPVTRPRPRSDDDTVVGLFPTPQ